MIVSFPFNLFQNLDDHNPVLKIIHSATKTNEHNGTVNWMDSNIAKNIYVTGGADGFVKVWTNQKELIREIWFPEEIDTVCLLNEQCDILIGHGTKVSIIYAENYKPFYIIKEQDIFITEEDKEAEDTPKIVKEKGKNLR